MDVKGRYMTGRENAETQAELAAYLQASGLLLITAHPEVEKPSLPVTTAPVVPSSRVDDRATEVSLQTLTWKHWLLLAGIIGGGLLHGIWRTYQKRHPAGTTDYLTQKMALLERNMTRQQVEQILATRYPGYPDPAKTWYYVPPQFIVEIPYGSEGGAGNDQNRTPLDGMRIFPVPSSDRNRVRP